MSITLETVIGTTKPLDPNIVIVNRIENIENPEINGLLLTANFVRNIWTDRESNGYYAGEAEEIGRYVVINRPENLGQLLLETVAKDEYERTSLYVLEIEEWNDKERKKMKDWGEGEQRRLEEYQLEQEITEEEARKAKGAIQKKEPRTVVDRLWIPELDEMAKKIAKKHNLDKVSIFQSSKKARILIEIKGDVEVTGPKIKAINKLLSE